MRKIVSCVAVMAAFLCSNLLFAASPVKPAKYRSALLNRFLGYVQVDSQSQYGQFYGDWVMSDEVAKAGELLYGELQNILQNNNSNATIHFSQDKYIYVHFPSNLSEKLTATVPVLGMSAHYDTTPEVPGRGIKPNVIKSYQGGKVVINEENGIVLDPQTMDSYLNQLIGETIVTSDGTTILGADDKAGTSIVVTVIETLAENPQIAHGNLQFMLVPSEDVGLAAHRVDTEYFKPEIYFDFDGEVNGEIMAESFTAKGFLVTLRGRAAHPSEAASQNGLEVSEVLGTFLQQINQANDLKPNQSQGREPYIRFAAGDIKPGDEPESLRLQGYARFFTDEEWNRMKELVKAAITHVNVVYGTKNEVIIDEASQYKNLADGMHPMTKNIVAQAAADAGVTPRFITVRGGITPGMMNARHGITGMGLWTGQQRVHSEYEWLSEKDMFSAYQTALNIIEQTIIQSIDASGNKHQLQRELKRK